MFPLLEKYALPKPQAKLCKNHKRTKTAPAARQDTDAAGAEISAVPPCICHSKEKEAELPDNRKAPTFIAEDRGEQSRYHPTLYS